VSVCSHPDRPITEADTQLMRALMPHLQRAFQVQRTLAEANARASALAESLDHLSCGAILIDAAGRLLFLNDSARETLAECDGLIDAGGRLRAARPHDNAALNSLIDGAIQTSAQKGLESGGVVAVRRPSGKRSLNVTVSPLPSATATTMGASARVVVFIADPDSTRSSDVEVLSRLFGLTKMEGRVANLLLQDKSVREIGDLLGLQENSIRFHLKRLFVKTDTRRQGQLVALLMSTLLIRNPR